MAKRKKNVETPSLASSQLVAMAERAIENGAVVAMIIYLDDEKGLGFTITEEASPEQVVFMMRQAEHMFLSPGNGYEDTDDD